MAVAAGTEAVGVAGGAVDGIDGGTVTSLFAGEAGGEETAGMEAGTAGVVDGTVGTVVGEVGAEDRLLSLPAITVVTTRVTTGTVIARAIMGATVTATVINREMPERKKADLSIGSRALFEGLGKTDRFEKARLMDESRITGAA